MRKIAAHLLFTGKEFIRNGVLTLDDSGTVLAVSSLGETVSEQGGTEFYNGIVSPGFVNAHCHLELSHMHGILPQGKGMTAFCKGIMSLKNLKSKDEQTESMILRDKQMFDEGIVAAGDISNSDASFEVKRNSSIEYHTFIECLGFDYTKADKIIENALHTKAEAKCRGLAASLTPHAPYSMSEMLFAESVKQGIAGEIISIHNQESEDEMQLFKFKSGKMRELFGVNLDEFLDDYDNSIDRIMKYIDKDTRLLLVHNVYTTPSDYERACARNRNIAWILCPSSNLYIENRLPDVNMLAGRNALVAIGTDSLSSNTDLSMMQELRILDSHFRGVGLANLLRWATINGAKALNMSDKFGDFTSGKKPGVVLISGVDFVNMRFTADSKARRIDL